MSLGPSLKAACEAARLSVEQLGLLAGVDNDRIIRFEHGEPSLTSQELDRCAGVLGLRLDDLECWTGQEEPLGVLLRGTLGQAVDLGVLLATEVHVALGEFQRTVREVRDLEVQLGLAPIPLPSVPSTTSSQGGRRGEELSTRARAALGLGIAPIPSMRRLVEETLGITVIWVTTDHLDASIDGASTSAPRRAILVNLFEPSRYPWRARTTLAHELCHVLFDHRARSTLFSPARSATTKPRFAASGPTDALTEMETVARAFSACFLAPSEGVMQAVGSLDPTTEGAIHRVGQTYGVGRQVATNRLCHVFRISDERRASMELRVPTHYAADFSGDEVATVDGFRGDPLRGLVRRALASGHIAPSRARRILRLAPTEALPFPELGDLSAPTITRKESMRRVAQAELRNRDPGSDLDAMNVQETGGGFRVTVVGGGVGCNNPTPRGYIDLTSAGDVSDVQISAPNGAE